MVDHILRLDIKPVRTYNDGRQRKTTLTSFEKVLKNKESGIQDSTGTSAQKTETQKDVGASETEKTGQSSSDTHKVVFSDPVTGQAVTRMWQQLIRRSTRPGRGAHQQHPGRQQRIP